MQRDPVLTRRVPWPDQLLSVIAKVTREADESVLCLYERLMLLGYIDDAD